MLRRTTAVIINATSLQQVNYIVRESASMLLAGGNNGCVYITVLVMRCHFKQPIHKHLVGKSIINVATTFYTLKISNIYRDLFMICYTVHNI